MEKLNAEQSSSSQLEHHAINCRNVGVLDVYLQASVMFGTYLHVYTNSAVCRPTKHGSCGDLRKQLTGTALLLSANKTSCIVGFCDVDDLYGL